MGKIQFGGYENKVDAIIENDRWIPEQRGFQAITVEVKYLPLFINEKEREPHKNGSFLIKL